jgi:AraC family transcriptional regulator of adaptative response / DNA-3-methyladenine glycosylase II
LQRELGVSPVELAQTHRLRLARRLLADTGLPVIDVAFASGFESLRRFNVAFREKYGTSPGQARKAQRAKPSETTRTAAPEGDLHA